MTDNEAVAWAIVITLVTSLVAMSATVIGAIAGWSGPAISRAGKSLLIGVSVLLLLICLQFGIWWMFGGFTFSFAFGVLQLAILTGLPIGGLILGRRLVRGRPEFRPIVQQPQSKLARLLARYEPFELFAWAYWLTLILMCGGGGGISILLKP